MVCLGRQSNVVQAQGADQACIMLVHMPLQSRPGTAAGDLLQSLHMLQNSADGWMWSAAMLRHKCKNR